MYTIARPGIKQSDGRKKPAATPCSQSSSYLVNGSTASAAEIIARCKIMRDTGSNSDLAAHRTNVVTAPSQRQRFKITTACYLTPSGRSFDEQGLVPTALVPNGDEATILAAAVSTLVAP